MPDSFFFDIISRVKLDKVQQEVHVAAWRRPRAEFLCQRCRFVLTAPVGAGLTLYARVESRNRALGASAMAPSPGNQV